MEHYLGELELIYAMGYIFSLEKPSIFSSSFSSSFVI